MSVLAVGVHRADVAELNKIAAPTSYKNVFFSPTFEDFASIEGEFLRSLCSDELLTEYKLQDEARQELHRWFPAFLIMRSCYQP